MSSTPSAPALTAVLRCQGNIWSRNPPTKRPAAAAYGGQAQRPGERVVERVDRKTLREKGSRETRKSACCANVSPSSAHSPRDAHPAACGAPNAPVRQLALKLIPKLPGTDTCCQIIQMIKHEKYAAHICETASVRGIVKVTVTSSRLVEHSGQIPAFVLTGWCTLKSTCLSLTALVSEIVFCKLAVLRRTRGSPCGAPPQQRRDAASVRNSALQRQMDTCTVQQTPTPLKSLHNRSLKTHPTETESKSSAP